MKVTTSDSQTLDIDPKDIVRFGTEVERIYNKGNKKFRSFHSNTWVEDKDKNRYYTKLGIRAVKSLFDNYSNDKTVLEQYKGDKVVKATEWDCEVLVDGVEKIPKKQRPKVYEAVKNGKHFTLDGHYMFFHIFWNVYKKSQTDEYVYLYLEKDEIVRIDLPLKGRRENDIEEYVRKNILVD